MPLGDMMEGYAHYFRALRRRPTLRVVVYPRGGRASGRVAWELHMPLGYESRHSHKLVNVHGAFINIAASPPTWRNH